MVPIQEYFFMTHVYTFFRERVVLVLIAVLAFAPFLYASSVWMNERSEQIPPSVPSVSAAALEQHLLRAEALLKQEPGASPRDYFTTLIEVKQISWIHKKYLQEHPNTPHYAKFGSANPSISGYMNDILQLQDRYKKRFGDVSIMETGAIPEVRSAVNAVLDPELPPIATDAWSYLVYGYALSLLAMAVYFWLSVAARDMRPYLEIDKILFATVFWPYMIFKYPVEISVREQMHRLRQRIAYVFAGLLSALPVGVQAKPAASTKSDGPNSTTMVLKDWVKGASLFVGVKDSKVGGNGVLLDAEPVVTWDAGVSLAGGWSISYSGTRSLAGSNRSNENDWTVGYTTALSEKESLSLSLAWWDIQPLASVQGGDFIVPSVEYRYAFDDVTLHANAEYDYVTSGIDKSGWSARVGARKTFDLGSDIKLTAGASVLYADGPFGREEGFLARGDLQLSVPIDDRVRATLGVKAIEPLSDFRDRESRQEVTLGLAYAF